MRFILGYIPGSGSKYDPRQPQVLLRVAVKHAGVDYAFDRFETDGAGRIARPVLRIYDSAEYPDEVVRHLLVTNQIVELAETAPAVIGDPRGAAFDPCEVERNLEWALDAQRGR